MKLHHTAISVKNLEASVDFYKNILGFEEVKRFARKDLGGKAAFLGLEGRFIELWQFDGQKDNQDDFHDLRTLGYKHIALEVPSIEDAYKTLKAKNLEVPEPQQGAAAKYIFIKDPDGLPIEILELNERF